MNTVYKQLTDDAEKLNKLYEHFQNYTIDEHLCDDDVASICTRWLKEYMIRQLTTMDN